MGDGREGRRDNGRTKRRNPTQNRANAQQEIGKVASSRGGSNENVRVLPPLAQQARLDEYRTEARHRHQEKIRNRLNFERLLHEMKKKHSKNVQSLLFNSMLE